MRYIDKQGLPADLSEALEEALAKCWSWAQFGSNRRGAAKRSLREVLRQEQRGLCAYSEISLNDFSWHIEHIKPQGEEYYPEFRFTYNNLVASAPIQRSCVPKEDLFGGHKKADRYDAELFIEPTEPQCGDFFQYTPSGGIEPSSDLLASDKERAVETIECLGLEESILLKNRRKKVYELMMNQVMSSIDQPDIVQKILDSYLEPDEYGDLKPFQSLVSQMAGK